MSNRRVVGLRCLLCAMILLASLGTARAQGSDQSPFIGVWIDKTATLSDEALDAAVNAITARDADPQHIVLLVHGFATNREGSTKQYTKVAGDVLKEYQALGQRAVVLGIQWDSDVGAPGDWLAKVALGGKDNPYIQKVAMSLDVGHVGLRQVLLRIQKQFPKANLDVFGHSLGCQVTMAALNPTAEQTQVAKGTLEPFQPNSPLSLNLICFAGADVDYDSLYRTKVQLQQQGAARLFCLTVAGRGSYRPQDAVLAARRLIRGDAAMGDNFPKLTTQQVDMLCKTRRLVIDVKDVPGTHELLKYYVPARTKRLAALAVALHDPAHPSALLQDLDKILAAPNTREALVPFLSIMDFTAQFYTLWRLENLLCGGAFHISDGYLPRFANEVQERPDQLKAMRFRSPCKVVTEGIWPTPRQMQVILDSMPGAHTPKSSGGFDVP